MKKHITKNIFRNYQVHLNIDASNILKFARDEFYQFMNESVKGIQNKDKLNTMHIYLGVHQASKDQLYKLQQKTSNSSAFFITKLGDNIYINGLSDYAVLYGVYELLKRVIDIEFYAKDVYTLKEKTEIKLEDFEIFSEPDFEYRHIGFYEVTQNNILASRLRVMSNQMSHEDKHPQSGDVISGDIYYDIWGGLWGHTMLKILPVANDSNGEVKHPEWFSEDLKQLCMTNNEARETFIKALKKHILQYPDAKMFMLGVMDEYTYCNCENCKQSHEKYGGPSGTHIRFINEVARNIKDWQKIVLPNSDFLLVAFAYLTYRNAPVKIVDNHYEAIDPSLIMEDNTAILIAPLDMASTYAINDSQNSFIKERFHQWKVLSKRIIVWDYHIYFDNYLAYMHNFKHYKNNLLFYRDCNVVLVYSEGALMDFSPGFHDLKVYLLSKLKWNTDLNLDELIENFLKAYYKEASPYIAKYLKRLDEHFLYLDEMYKKEGQRGYLSGYEIKWQLDYLTTTHWPKSLLIELRTLLRKSLNAVESNEAVMNRIKVELITIEYLWMELYMIFSTKVQILDQVEVLEKLIESTGIKRLTHWGFLPHLEKEEHFLKRKIESYKALYPMCDNERAKHDV